MCECGKGKGMCPEQLLSVIMHPHSMQVIHFEKYEGVQFANMATAICANLNRQMLGINH